MSAPPALEVVRVSTTSNPTAVAGAIAGIIRDKGGLETHTIGAGALNQAVKAIAIARGLLAPEGIDLVSRPGFKDVTVDGQERTVLCQVVQPA